MSAELPRLLGPYVLLEQLGEGAHGATFLARERDGRTPLVIKRLREGVLHRADLRARLRHEAQLAVAIEDPRVVRAVGVGLVDDVPYVAMELVEGWPLVDVLRTCHELRTPWPPGAVVAFVSELLHGLEALHGAIDPATGVRLEAVHRDLAPHNVMVRPSGQPVLIDLGLGRSALRRWETQTGALLGTPGYMAPEQVQRRVVDHRADLYAAGVLAFELLTLERYIPAGDLARSLRLTCEGAFRPPSALNPAVPRALDAVLERALALDPEGRYPTAAALRDALCAVVEPAPEAARGAVPEALHRLLAVRRAGRAVLMLTPTPPGPEREPRTIVFAQPSRRAATLVLVAEEPRARVTDAARGRASERDRAQDRAHAPRAETSAPERTAVDARAEPRPDSEDPDDATHLVDDGRAAAARGDDPDDATDRVGRERAAAAARASDADPDDATHLIDDGRAAAVARFHDVTLRHTEALPVPIRLPTSALRPLVVASDASVPSDLGATARAPEADTGPVDTRDVRGAATPQEHTGPFDARDLRGEATGPVDTGDLRGEATGPVDTADLRSEATGPVDAREVRSDAGSTQLDVRVVGAEPGRAGPLAARIEPVAPASLPAPAGLRAGAIDGRARVELAAGRPAARGMPEVASARGAATPPEARGAPVATVRPLPETVRALPETVRALPETVRPLPETVRPLPETVRPLPETAARTSRLDPHAPTVEPALSAHSTGTTGARPAHALHHEHAPQPDRPAQPSPEPNPTVHDTLIPLDPAGLVRPVAAATTLVLGPSDAAPVAATPPPPRPALAVVIAVIAVAALAGLAAWILLDQAARDASTPGVTIAPAPSRATAPRAIELSPDPAHGTTATTAHRVGAPLAPSPMP